MPESILGDAEPGTNRTPPTGAFRINGIPLPYCRHGRVKGTERCVEMAVAYHWAKSLDNWVGLVEIGVTTQYYLKRFWPRRLRTVIDPYDNHSTLRMSLFDFNFTGRDVLSISTIEHVGDGRYGGQEAKTPLDAFHYIIGQANRSLIIVPYGWEGGEERVGPLQEHLLGLDRTVIMSRTGNKDNTWEQSDKLLPYGPWGNTILVVETGSSWITK